MFSRSVLSVDTLRFAQICSRQLHKIARGDRCSVILASSTSNQHLPTASASKRYKGYHPGPKIAPRKPNFDYSGDLDVSLPAVDLTASRVEYKDCTELESADEVTKKLVSLQFAPSSEVLRYRVDEMIKAVQKHELDFSSRGVLIAKKTVEIRNGIRHSLDFPKDKVSKGKLINKIQKRRKFLKLLRQEDYPLFEKIQEFLNVKYEPVYRHVKPTKRERRVNEAVEKAVALRQEKMEALRLALQEEKNIFVKEKELLLSEIEQELRVIEEEERNFADLDGGEEEEEASTPLVNKPHVSDKLR